MPQTTARYIAPLWAKHVRAQRCCTRARGKGALGSGLGGERFDAGLCELEANQPLAGGTAAGDFRWSKFPTASRVQSEVGEILAWSRSIEPSIGNVAGGVHVNADADSDRALNRGACSVGNVRQNLVENVAVPGAGCSLLRHVRRRDRLRAELSRSGREDGRLRNLFSRFFPRRGVHRILSGGRRAWFCAPRSSRTRELSSRLGLGCRCSRGRRSG